MFQLKLLSETMSFREVHPIVEQGSKCIPMLNFGEAERIPMGVLDFGEAGSPDPDYLSALRRMSISRSLGPCNRHGTFAECRWGSELELELGLHPLCHPGLNVQISHKGELEYVYRQKIKDESKAKGFERREQRRHRATSKCERETALAMAVNDLECEKEGSHGHRPARLEPQGSLAFTIGPKVHRPIWTSAAQVPALKQHDTVKQKAFVLLTCSQHGFIRADAAPEAEPVANHCGHVFHRDCVERLMEIQAQPSCSICKVALPHAANGLLKVFITLEETDIDRDLQEVVRTATSFEATGLETTLAISECQEKIDILRSEQRYNTKVLAALETQYIAMEELHDAAKRRAEALKAKVSTLNAQLQELDGEK
ncbi:hypothetical protein FKP32DRAFT_1604835 [Trametes sanguinea]|nr:hypothetical protein FKP32DRAFT_1604835 [Trametes sanguinea]